MRILALPITIGTVGIPVVFRGLEFEPDAEIGQKGVLFKGLLMRSSLFFLIFFMGTVLPATAYSEDDSDGALQVTKLGNITIESDDFNWKTKEKIVEFSEDVTAQREDLIIECDRLCVYYSEAENGDVNYDKILATGNVRITRADGSSGTAEKVVYDFAEETVVMTGQPAFKRGKDSYTGSSLTYHLRDESITGTDVKVVLYQKNEKGVLTGGQ